jgi:hypothetical protein
MFLWKWPEKNLQQTHRKVGIILSQEGGWHRLEAYYKLVAKQKHEDTRFHKDH